MPHHSSNLCTVINFQHVLNLFFLLVHNQACTTLIDRARGRANLPSQFLNCSLVVKKEGHSAGEALNVKATCKYNMALSSYSYEFTWDPPEEVMTPVVEYRLEIRYGLSQKSCFQIPRYVRKFSYNKTVGFRPETSLLYALTSQPIVRKNHIPLVSLPACPLAPQPKPLRNEVIPPGTNIYFRCQFEIPPVPKAVIEWYFTKDKTNCLGRQPVITNKHISISENKDVLQIYRANKEHIGCYVLTATNGVGDEKEEKGYLDLIPSHHKRKRNIWRALGPLIGAVIGVSLIIVMLFIIVMNRCFPSPKQVVLDADTVGKSRTVYLSHCSEDEKEKLLLAKFASIIEARCSYCVVIDICSEVQINSMGGYSRWVAENIKLADKVLVVVSPSFLSAYNTPRTSEDLLSENIRKIHTECNHVTNIFDGVHSPKDVIVVIKDVEYSQLPDMFTNKCYIPFPEKLDTQNLNFLRIKEMLLTVEPRYSSLLTNS